MKKVILIVLLLCSGLSFAQTPEKDTISESSKKIDLKVMPFISYNRNLDFMFGAIPMVMYKLNPKDEVSPKSMSGLAAVYTTNKSYFISFFNRLYLAEDSWRFTLYGFTGDYNSQFFMSDEDYSSFYDFGTEATIINAGFQKRIFKKTYLGLSYMFSHFYTEYENNISPANTTNTHGLEINSLYDSRNTVYYPTEGIKLKLRWLTQPEWLGNDVFSNKIKMEYNQYFGARKNNDVFAARFFGVFGLGDIAFEQQVTVGGKDIRGYSEGKYRGDGLMDIQGEYRYNFHEKMGLVGFVGLATIYGSETTAFDWDLYPGGGLGFRYKVFDETHFNIGLDAAVGKGDWGVYFRIGEAF